MIKRGIKIIFFLLIFCFLFFKAPLPVLRSLGVGGIKGVLGIYFCQASSEIVFNEICWMGNEDSSNNEWIELKNNTEEEVDITDWIIEAQDGSPIIDLEGIIPAEGIFLLERTDDESSPATADMFYTGALGNSGEILQLKNAKANIIDEIDFSEGWPAGDNDTKQTMELSGTDWQTSLDPGGTPGDENSSGSAEDASASLEQSEEEEDDNEANYTSDDISVPDQLAEEESKEHEMIVISEIFPNPQGDDRQGEFIELCNIGDRAVDLQDWRLKESGGREYVIQDHINLKPGRNFALYREQSNLILDNDGDKVYLFSPKSRSAVDKVIYGEYDMAWSYARDESGDWFWSRQPTPGLENIIIKKNLPPEVIYSIPQEAKVGEPVWFEASDSVDPENDELDFLWNFGDGVEVNLSSPSHRYLSPGEYEIVLIVDDGINQVEKKEKIFVSGEDDEFFSKNISDYDSSIVINEIFPSPAGKDSEEEFIELKNIGENEVDIFGWSIDDEEGGSDPYYFDSHIRLSPGLVFLIPRPQSKIALNNEGDKARILDKQGNVVFETEYLKAPQGQSWARGENNKFFWTANPSPGTDNNINLSNNEIYNLSNNDQKNTEQSTKSKKFNQTTLAEINNFEAGQEIRIIGKVAVEPGVLASQYFYITGSPGLQIYSYYKNFPKLELGDMIEVSGEISEINNEKRLKTKTAEDIVILYHDEPPEPEKILAEEMDELSFGELIFVSGQVVDKKGSHIYLYDGTGEVDVYIKSSTDIGVSMIEEADQLEVVGLISDSSSGKIIIPRYSDDIKKINESGAVEDSGSPFAGINMAEAKSDWAISPRNVKQEILSHVSILLLGALVALSIWKWRKTKA